MKALFLILISALALAAPPNHKVIVTDMLDDDIRALEYMFADPAQRGNIDALVISTGNVQLKKAIAETLLARYGLNIPVFAGTSSNLSDNSVTAFAGNLELEGHHILPEDVRRTLAGRPRVDGDAAEKLAAMLTDYRANGAKLDILFLTAPTDVVKAIRLQPEAARAALGDAVAMGFWKKTPQGFIAPYNTMADPQAVLQFLDLYQEGYFERLLHVSSDTVQLRSGLPGGYFPVNEEGVKLRTKLKALMESHDGLRPFLRSAAEYGAAWRTTAARDFGSGFTDSTRWVVNTLANPDEAAAFYLADTAGAYLSSLDPTALAGQQTTQVVVRPPHGPRIPGKPFFFSTAPGGGRPIIELEAFDGLALLRTVIDNMEKALTAGRITTASPANLLTDISPVKEYHRPLGRKPLSPNGTVIVFKNSPDDWFALQQLLSTEQGRHSLRRGGIICEGFDPEIMKNSVQRFLASLHITDVPVAAGYAYSNAEIKNLPPNFKGEIAMRREGQADRAFRALPPTRESLSLTPEELLVRANGLASRAKAKVNYMILGEGIDVVRAFNEGRIGKTLGRILVMGGGRLDPGTNKFVFTRNWLPHGEEVLTGLGKMAKVSSGVFIFSSNEFGGAMVSAAEGTIGNATKAEATLKTFSQKVPPMQALQEHWENWSRLFSWAMKPGDLPFDPEAPLKVVSTSPIALHIAEAFEFDPTLDPNSHITMEGISPESLFTEKTLKPEAGSKFFWLRQTGGPNICSITNDFNFSCRKTVSRWYDNIFNETVRRYGLMSRETLRIMDDLEPVMDASLGCTKDYRVFSSKRELLR